MSVSGIHCQQLALVFTFLLKTHDPPIKQYPFYKEENMARMIFGGHNRKDEKYYTHKKNVSVTQIVFFNNKNVSKIIQ